MKIGRKVAGMTLVLLGVVWQSGCGPDSKDAQIQKLQEDLDRIAGENNDCQSKLAGAMRDADQARARALQLQGMLDDARRQLAQQPPIMTQAQPAASNVPPGWTEGNQDFAWTDIAEDILFDAGKADLKSSGRSKLSDVTRQIQSSFPGREIWVIGHTDSDPISKSKWKDNLEFSAQRGLTVTRELYKLAIDASRVVAGGQGEHRPKAPNSSRANKQINRRVQIVAVVVPRGGSAPMMEEGNTRAGG